MNLTGTQRIIFYLTLCSFCAQLLVGTITSDIENTVKQLESERQQLNETIWANEKLAQQYERYFMKLWDSIRVSEDKLSILNEFKFGKLSLGEDFSKEELKWGILKYQFKDGGKIYKQKDWASWLEELKLRYRVIQTEWYHVNFETTETGNQSEVKATLHVTTLDEKERYILNVRLKVSWSEDKDRFGNYYPLTIDATDLNILQRNAGPVFHERLRARSTLNDNAFRNVIVYDLNEDGLSEIILPEGNVVYWNKGDFNFERDTFCDFPTQRIGVSLIADLTGDGRPDFLTIADEYPVLYEMDAEGRYSSVGKSILATVEPFKNSWAITTGDINNDGLLDLWVGQYKPPYFYGQMPTPFYDANDGYPSYLLVNQGGGRFKDETESSGLAAKRHRRTYSSSFLDLNGDKMLDLLVVSDFSGADVYYNRGNGTFTDVTSTAIDERSAFGMSHSFGDYNRDGQLDFYMGGMGSTTARRLDSMGLGREDRLEINNMRMPMGYGNRMYLASAEGTYRQPEFIEQVNRSGWSWGMSTFDFDSDGAQDIYIANGNYSMETCEDYCSVFWTQDIYSGNSENNPALENLFSNTRLNFGTEAKGGWNPYEKNVLFMNLDGDGFINVSFLMGAAFAYDSRTVVTDDLDNDGRPDLIVTSVDWMKQTRDLHVYQNLWPTKNNWLGVRLPEGKGFSPFGAKVAVVSDSGKQIQSLVTGDSHLAQHSLQKHFGLGEDNTVKYFEVLWPDGRTTRVNNPAINQYHVVTP